VNLPVELPKPVVIDFRAHPGLEVLIQSAAESHVQQLYSAADREHRQPAFENPLQEIELHGIASRGHGPGTIGLCSVPRGIDILPAGQKESGGEVEQTVPRIGIVQRRKYQR
jgi:hypothetical protein